MRRLQLFVSIVCAALHSSHSDVTERAEYRILANLEGSSVLAVEGLVVDPCSMVWQLTCSAISVSVASSYALRPAACGGAFLEIPWFERLWCVESLHFFRYRVAAAMERCHDLQSFFSRAA